LYISDQSGNTVQRFNAITGAYLGTFVTASSGGLKLPAGLDFGPNHNLLVGSKGNGPTPGSGVVEYDGRTGAPLRDLVSSSDPNAPFSPRGIVRGPDHRLFVADIGDFGRSGHHPGLVRVYDDRTGQFIRDLQLPLSSDEFNPRGVVIGPDGNLYVSTRNLGATGGHIFKFDPLSGRFEGVFIASTADNDLNQPGVPVFGPDGNLYVSSFAADATDTDKILEFNGKTGAYLGKIDLDQPGQPRAFVQDVLFGPGGKLFAPIQGNGPDTGEVRRYDVRAGTFDVFVPPHALGGPLGNPFYLTFGLTNPFTFSYARGSFGFDIAAGPNDASASPTVIPAPLQTIPGLASFLMQSLPATQTAKGALTPPLESKPVSLSPATQATLSALLPAQPGTAARSPEWARDWLFAGLGSKSVADEPDAALTVAKL
jgi:hypothetical protein